MTKTVKKAKLNRKTVKTSSKDSEKKGSWLQNMIQNRYGDMELTPDRIKTMNSFHQNIPVPYDINISNFQNGMESLKNEACIHEKTISQLICPNYTELNSLLDSIAPIIMGDFVPSEETNSNIMDTIFKENPKIALWMKSLVGYVLCIHKKSQSGGSQKVLDFIREKKAVLDSLKPQLTPNKARRIKAKIIKIIFKTKFAHKKYSERKTAGGGDGASATELDWMANMNSSVWYSHLTNCIVWLCVSVLLFVLGSPACLLGILTLILSASHFIRLKSLSKDRDNAMRAAKF